MSSKSPLDASDSLFGMSSASSASASGHQRARCQKCDGPKRCPDDGSFRGRMGLEAGVWTHRLRLLLEVSLNPTVTLDRLKKIIRGLGGFGFVGPLLCEAGPQQKGICQARREPLQQKKRLASPPNHKVTDRMLGRIEDGISHHPRLSEHYGSPEGAVVKPGDYEVLRLRTAIFGFKQLATASTYSGRKNSPEASL